jgi:hypothetical protein
MIAAIRGVNPDGWISYEPRVAAPANGQPAFIAKLEVPQIFELAFDPSPSAAVPTEIYLPATRHYPAGWSLEGCEGANGCSSSWDRETETLRILTPNQTSRV